MLQLFYGARPFVLSYAVKAKGYLESDDLESFSVIYAKFYKVFIEYFDKMFLTSHKNVRLVILCKRKGRSRVAYLAYTFE